MLNEKDIRAEIVKEIAQKMAISARTAPKAKGLDLLEIVIACGDDIERLSKKMQEIGERESHPTFLRDAQSVKSAQAVLIIGTKLKTVGLKHCSFCGYANCAECEKSNGICVYNPGDLGIAVGSASAVAADSRVDNRIMYTVGKASIEAGIFSGDVKIAYGIPLSVSGKNPFFDRK